MPDAATRAWKARNTDHALRMVTAAASNRMRKLTARQQLAEALADANRPAPMDTPPDVPDADDASLRHNIMG